MTIKQPTQTAVYTLAVAIISLAITIGVGIWRIGTFYGSVTQEHQQIFRELQQLSQKKCPQ